MSENTVKKEEELERIELVERKKIEEYENDFRVKRNKQLKVVSKKRKDEAE